MPNVRVTVNGPEKENTISVNVGAARWGHNGYPYGTAIAIPNDANQKLTVVKTTDPHELDGYVSITADVTLAITVDNDSLKVVPIY